jgi:hypothetical protein
MKAIKLALLLGVSFVSLSQVNSNNSRDLASVDCVNCEGSIETNSKSVSGALKDLEKIVPVKHDNMALFENMKKEQQCGEFFSDSNVKFDGRLSKNQVHHIKVDPMHSDIEDAGMAFMMNLPEEGRMKTSKHKKPFLGKTYEGDLMMVERVFSGKKIVGYNVTMSLCKFKVNKKKIIHSDNKIEEMAFGFMSLDTEENCGSYLDIDMAKAGFVSNPKSTFKRRIPMEKEFQALDCE